MDMHRWFHLIGCLIVSMTVAACGGSSGGTLDVTVDPGTGDGGDGDVGGGGDTDPPPDPNPPVDPLNIVTSTQRSYYLGAFQAGFETVRDNARDGGLALSGDLPSFGSNTYNGYMEIGFFSTPNANIRGEATLIVSLQDGATTGSATGFMGPVVDSTMATQVVSYEGDVIFSGGSLTAVGNDAAALSMSINGAFDNGVQSFNIAGDLSGYLYGSTANGLVVSGGSNALKDDIVTIVDGGSVDGSATLWALKE